MAYKKGEPPNRVKTGSRGPRSRMVRGSVSVTKKSAKPKRMSNRRNMTTAAQKRMGAEGPKRRSR